MIKQEEYEKITEESEILKRKIELRNLLYYWILKDEVIELLLPV